MRQEVLDFISGFNLGSFTLSSELPWDESGVALYLRNLRRIYVDVTNYTNEPLLQTLDGLNIDTEAAEVRVFFANDAKQLSASYDELMRQLRAGKNSIEVVGNYRREFEAQTRFEEDKLVTEVAYRFIKIT